MLYYCSRVLLSPNRLKKPDVVRLLYGKRRNTPHQHSLGKPSVTALLEQLEVSSGTSSPNALVQGLHRAFTVGELGRAEVLQLLRKHRKLKRLDRSRVLWEWCTTPIGNASLASEDGCRSPGKATLPPQAALWTAAHDAVFLAHINDTGPSQSSSLSTASAAADSSSSASPHASTSAFMPTTTSAASSSLQRGGSSSSASSFSLAERVYQRATEAGRGNHRALIGGLLTSYARQDDWCGALKAYMQHIVLDRKPTDSYHLHTVMNVCRRCGAWAQGIELFQIAVGSSDGTESSADTPAAAAGAAVAEKVGQGDSHPTSNDETDEASETRNDNGATGSHSFSLSPPTITPQALVPRPNAVVYLELLRLFAQSHWPGKHRHALAILQALHENSVSSPSSTPSSHSRTPSTKKRRVPFELTAGHYNAVLLAMKPSRPYPFADGTLEAPLTSTRTLPPALAAGRRLYQQMKQRGVQPSAETLPALLSLHPRHLSHVLFCVAECHQLGLPVTADMYRSVLTTLMIRTYASINEPNDDTNTTTNNNKAIRRLGHHDRRNSPAIIKGRTKESLPGGVPAHQVANHHNRQPQDSAEERYWGWTEAVAERDKRFRQSAAEEASTGGFALDVVRFVQAEYKRYESFDDPAIISPQGDASSRGGWRHNANGVEEDDEAQKMTPTSSTSLAGHRSSSYSSPDMIGLHLTTALVDVLLSHPHPMHAQHWIAIFAPRIRPLLAALTAGASDRLGLEPSEMFPLSSSSASGQLPVPNSASSPAPSSSFLWQVHGRVAVVDHNVVLSPLFESLSFHYDAVIVPFSVLRVLVRRLAELPPNSKKGRHTRRALRRLREKAQQQDSQQNMMLGSGGRKDDCFIRVLPLAHQLYAHRYLEGSLWWQTQQPSAENEPGHHLEGEGGTITRLDGNERQPYGYGSPTPPHLAIESFSSPLPPLSPSGERLLKALMESSTRDDEKYTIMSKTSTKTGTVDRARSSTLITTNNNNNNNNNNNTNDKSGRMSLRHETDVTRSIHPSSGLYRPNIAITMPERVLAVACMLKTLNPEASVHVLSSSAGSARRCPLKEAVKRWNHHQRRRHPFPEAEATAALTLTHVFHPTELSSKAPSELQLPSGSL